MRLKDESQPPSGQLGSPGAQRLPPLAPAAVVVVDPHGRIVVTDAQTEEMFGYTSQELGEMNLSALIPERLREAFERMLAECVTSADGRCESQEVELAGRRKDGWSPKGSTSA